MSEARGQRKTKAPCPVCALHRERCICAVIPKLSLKTQVLLLIHAKELRRATNSGQLAVRALTNSSLHVRGASRERLDLTPYLTDEYETYLFYPSPEARDLATLHPRKPVRLIVPDGNWRQAAKVHSRHPELADVPRVKLSEVNLSQHHLRKEHMPEGFSTLEAIARAIHHLEGAEAGASLMALYHAKLRATLEGRGVPL